MVRVREVLHSFRPAGAPGAAGAVGVPADRGADLAAELEPEFAQLASTERECARIAAQMRPNALEKSTSAAVAAERDAAVIRRHAGERMGFYVDLVVASVGRLIDDERFLDERFSDQQLPGAT